MRKLTLALLLALLPLVAIAQTKISALPAAAQLDGTEVAPIVQGGTTKKATTGNLVFGASIPSDCIGTLGAPNVKPIMIANAVLTTPTGIECSNTFGNSGNPGNSLSWDESNNALYLPGNAPTILGGNSNPLQIAFKICTGAFSLGGCNNAIFITGGGAGAVVVTQRNLNLQTSYMLHSGSTPATTSSTCTFSSATGGLGGGALVASSTGACTIKLNFTADTSYPINGFICTAVDETTPADTFHQTAHDGTSCTLSGTQASGDTILYTAQAF